MFGSIEVLSRPASRPMMLAASAPAMKLPRACGQSVRVPAKGPFAAAATLAAALAAAIFGCMLPSEVDASSSMFSTLRPAALHGFRHG